MKLKRILKNNLVLDVRGPKEIEITGICSHSQLVAPGNLFIAKKGLNSDAASFIPEAIANGAIAVLTDVYNPFLEEITQLISSDIEEVEVALARAYYENPDEELYVVGITGTNGKTTTSYLIKHLLQGLHRPCGLIGTIECDVGRSITRSTHTTPDLLTNLKLFREMRASHCKAVVMEVSSHALAQGRVRSIDFDAAVFTNLTPEHLDYHETMENYAAIKAKLFSSLEDVAPSKKKKGKKAVINSDSEASVLMINNSNCEVITYGIVQDADVQARNVTLSEKGMSFEISFRGKKAIFTSSLIGRFNVYNVLAAVAIGLGLEDNLEKIVSILQTFKAVSGRLEKVANRFNFNIFVDYAHTHDALQNVLETLREIKKGRLITVFGCGGNRDRKKRAKMGQVAEDLSDLIILTTDNPRQEDPVHILNEILEGFQNPSTPLIEVDRKAAIFKAVQMARSDDIILIAGKGHETYQIFAHHTIDFDDRKIAFLACEEL